MSACVVTYPPAPLSERLEPGAYVAVIGESAAPVSYRTAVTLQENGARYVAWRELSHVKREAVRLELSRDSARGASSRDSCGACVKPNYLRRDARAVSTREG